MIKNYLFDLDGTLLPLNEDDFIERYMRLIGQKLDELGFDPVLMVKRLWQGTKAMVNNNGNKTNEEIFWEIFYPESEGKEDLKKNLENFYRNEFNQVLDSTQPSLYSQKIIRALKEKGHNIYLLTNPIFPWVATKARIEWAGLNPEDFIYITTYENSKFAKPNLKYYENILEQFDLNPSETIMVGNDVHEDMVVSELKVNTYLVKDCLKNTNNIDFGHLEQGLLSDFYKKYILKD